MADSRRVHRLHLHATREEDVRRGAILVEDAIRMASFPDADAGRLFVLRRLDLGRIRHSAAPTTIALQAATAFREAALGAVRFDSPTATNSDVVWFPGMGAALSGLARNHALGRPADEWFWAKVVADWKPEADRPSKWRILLEAAARLPGGLLIQAAIVDTAVSAGLYAELLDALNPDDARALIESAGWIEAPRPAEHTDRAGAPTIVPAAVTDRLDIRGLPHDDRTLWLLAMMVVHHQPARAADRRLATRVQSWIVRRAQNTSSLYDRGLSRRSAELPNLSDESLRANAREGGHSAPIQRAIKPAPRPAQELRAASDEKLIQAPPEVHKTLEQYGRIVGGDSTSTSDTQSEGRRRDVREADVEYPFDLERTAVGGLLFLTHVLKAVGIEALLESQPELLDAGFPARMMRHAAISRGVDPDDIIPATLEAIGGVMPLPVHISLPGIDGAIITRSSLKRYFDSPFEPWLLVADRWCGRHVEMSLSALILRPARFAGTLTHMHVLFELSQLDLRVRRVALDADPGWVPWLGRIVQFHYVDADGSAV